MATQVDKNRPTKDSAMNIESDQQELGNRIAPVSTRHNFIKDAPTLAYRITSGNPNDLPEVIRKAMGLADQTGGEGYKDLTPFIGSIVNLQMKDATTPDFYPIGADAFAGYRTVTASDVSVKNAKYLGRVKGVLGGLVDSNDPNLIAVLRTKPQSMVKMSEAGYPVDTEVKINVKWGDTPDTQTKPAGKDAYLANDGKQWYMINLDDQGLPISYVPAADQAMNIESDQQELVNRVAPVATRHNFIKDAPTLAYRITSGNPQDLPEAIRNAMGLADQTGGKGYADLTPFVGSIVNLQMKDATTADFYPIGKDAFAGYREVSSQDVSAKNAKYLGRVKGVLGGLVDSNDPNLIAVLRTKPQSMVKMSEVGYPIEAEVKIHVKWGETPDTQTKPAGKDAYLANDGKQWYMINLDDQGLPISYVPAADQAMSPDKAALANPKVDKYGGIDLSEQDSALQVTKDANGGVKVNVDQALIARIEREGMPEVHPVIINMQPLQSIFGVKVLTNTP